MGILPQNVETEFVTGLVSPNWDLLGFLYEVQHRPGGNLAFMIRRFEPVGEFAKVTVYPVHVQDRVHEGEGDEHWAAQSETKTHDVPLKASRFVRELCCEGKPREEIVCGSCGELLEVEYLWHACMSVPWLL
jgi:hypothetical protein